ncbi:GNAT family N-acetyltransferase [Variovorax sp. J22R133]|uniref:GNAT family N-acetyltransferase n=1 Tax=Variovorax brevis TaxID=3053503 RepID=UPI002574FC54|nr:GNAT family N-acetyltransferase [Variovorax sp. J22R133]MDM0112304.1 GNAT family N-acetyltransferase [Variovorax sp. J22R133]
MISATTSPGPVASKATRAANDLSNESWTEMLRGGDRVLIRPINTNDVEMARKFIEALSPQSRRFRFLETLNSPSEELLEKLTAINPLTDMAYVAVVGEGTQQREVGVARFSAQADGHDCEFAVVVSDAWQEKGLGTLLMQHLIEAARRLGIEKMHSSDLEDNNLMRKFAQHLHLDHKRDPDDITQVLYTVDLRSHPVQHPVNAV